MLHDEESYKLQIEFWMKKYIEKRKDIFLVPNLGKIRERVIKNFNLNPNEFDSCFEPHPDQTHFIRKGKRFL